MFNINNGDLYSGDIDEQGNRTGYGRLYDAEKDEVYEGEFEQGTKNGKGTLIERDGSMTKATFQKDFMEGNFQKQPKLSYNDI